MNSETQRALQLLKHDSLTFAAVNEDKILTSKERGVKPLLKMIDDGISLDGYHAADKVIGKAAAFLYVLLKPEEVYSEVISKPALSVLEQNGIVIFYDKLADAIINRDNTGFCPMETAVKEVSDPETALNIIRQTLIQLKK